MVELITSLLCLKYSQASPLSIVMLPNLWYRLVGGRRDYCKGPVPLQHNLHAFGPYLYPELHILQVYALFMYRSMYMSMLVHVIYNINIHFKILINL